MTYIRMIKCPICQSSLHFYLIFDRKEYYCYFNNIRKELGFNAHFNKFDRKCTRCNRVYKSAYFKHGGKQNLKQVLEHSKRHRDLSPRPYTAESQFCEIQQMDEYLTLTPVKERAQDIPFESSLVVPDDFHTEFIEYKKKFKEDVARID